MGYREMHQIVTLATDLCDGFEEFSVTDMVNAIVKAIKDGYAIEQLTRLNDEDSTKVYDILSYYK